MTQLSIRIQYPPAAAITPSSHIGSNSLVVLVHHYAGAISGRIMSHAPGLTALLEADGQEILRTDASWKSSNSTEYRPSPDAWSSIPDVIDARLSPGAWTTTNFDDNAWTAAASIDGVNSSTFTFSANPSISHLGFGRDSGGSSVVRDFRLTATGAPPPYIRSDDSITSTFTNIGVLDLMTWNGTLPAYFINHGIVLDRNAVKIDSFAKSGNDFTIIIQGFTGHNYQLQYSTSLSNDWQNLGPAQPGHDASLVFIDPGGASSNRRFYRVSVVP